MKSADHQDERQPDATLALVLIERAGRARALLSPWNRRWQGPDRCRSLPMALSLSMTQELYRRLERQLGQSQVWQPDLGSLPETLAHFGELITQRYETPAGKYLVQPAPEEATGIDLVLPGAVSSGTKRSPEAWPPATRSFTSPMAMDPSQPERPFPGAATQAGKRRRPQLPRPRAGIRPLSRVEEVTPGGRSRLNRPSDFPLRAGEGEEVERAPLTLPGLGDEAVLEEERSNSLQSAAGQEESTTAAPATQEEKDAPPARGAEAPSRSASRSRPPSPAPGREQPPPDSSVIAESPEPARPGRRPTEKDEVGPLSRLPSPASESGPVTPRTERETGRPNEQPPAGQPPDVQLPAQQPPDARRQRPDMRPPDSLQAEVPGVRPPSETPYQAPAAQPAAEDVAEEATETDLVLAGPPSRPPAGEPQAKAEAALSDPIPARPRQAPSPPTLDVSRPAASPEEAAPVSEPAIPLVDATVDQPEPSLADHLLERATAKIALPLVTPPGPALAPDSGAAAERPSEPAQIRPTVREATSPAGQPVADLSTSSFPVPAPPIQEASDAGLVSRLISSPKAKLSPVAERPLVLAHRPRPASPAAQPTMTGGTIQRAGDGTAPLPMPARSRVIQRQIDPDGQLPAPTVPAVEPATAAAPDLDQLARQIYPFVRRLLKVERERIAGG